MKYDPNARNQLDRVDRQKSNRIDEVSELPARAQRGDIVLMKGSTYVFIQGKWVNVSGDLLTRLEAFEEELEAFEKKLEENQATEGPPGPQGERGERGARGPGSQGEPGTQGERGPQG